MIKTWFKCYVGLSLMAIQLGAVAQQDYFLATFQMPEVERGYVSLDYTYFSESLDVFNYSDKLESTFPLLQCLLNLQREAKRLQK